MGCQCGTQVLSQDLTTINAYWGQVTDITLSKEQVAEIQYMVIRDTLKNRDIKYITQYSFYYQKASDGPVEFRRGQGAYLNGSLRGLAGLEPGDRIIVSEIFGYVQDEGLKQIPTAIVMVIR